MGKGVAVNLGLHPNRVLALGLVIVSLISALVVVSVGSIPFLGLIVPNIVSRMLGDNLRQSMPWIAISGAGFVLICDIAGRLVRYPYEIPVATISGIVGSIVFLTLLLGRRPQHA